jgi:hypothetical protein
MMPKSDINFNNIYLKLNNTKISIAQHREENGGAIFLTSEVAVFNESVPSWPPQNDTEINKIYPFTTVEELITILRIIETEFAD